eukprot:Awhi_evm1s9763
MSTSSIPNHSQVASIAGKEITGYDLSEAKDKNLDANSSDIDKEIEEESHENRPPGRGFLGPYIFH